MSEKRVTLFVGERQFRANVSTLRAHSFYFRSMFSENWDSSSSSDEVFIDRDGNSFEVRLGWVG